MLLGHIRSASSLAIETKILEVELIIRGSTSAPKA
jgi:hypothetical protein